MHMSWAFQARLVPEYLTAKVDYCIDHTVSDVVFSVIQSISLCNRHDCYHQYSPTAPPLSVLLPSPSLLTSSMPVSDGAGQGEGCHLGYGEAIKLKSLQGDSGDNSHNRRQAQCFLDRSICIRHGCCCIRRQLLSMLNHHLHGNKPHANLHTDS